MGDMGSGKNWKDYGNYANYNDVPFIMDQANLKRTYTGSNISKPYLTNYYPYGKTTPLGAGAGINKPPTVNLNPQQKQWLAGGEGDYRNNFSWMQNRTPTQYYNMQPYSKLLTT